MGLRLRHVSISLILSLTFGVVGLAGPRAGAQPSSFTFPGRGWGHGVGMSQWGARGLAEQGWAAARILAHYYRGTAIETKQAPGEIRVGLLQERNDVTITGDGRFDFHDRSGSRRASGRASETWRIVARADKRLDVFGPGGGGPVFTSGVPVTIRYEQYGTVVKLPQTGHGYKRGRIDVDVNASTGRARAILMIGFEEYLYGLGEMPSSWPAEAKKAQAIAGRTYALEKILRLGQKRSGCNCAVYATTSDQAYVGVAHEVNAWTSAVQATRGLVVTYKGAPIQAFYSSSSGGFTESNENVWGGSALPYLRGVCDAGDYNGGANPHSNWSKKFSNSDLSTRMRQGGHDVGTVEDVDLLSPRGVSGRLLRVLGSGRGGVRVEGSRGTAQVSGAQFRSLLGLKSTLVHHPIYGGIRQRYDQLGCAPGLPVGAEFTWRDLDGTSRGRAQTFANGRLFWNASTRRVFWTTAGFLRKYEERRAKRHDLGLPTSDRILLAGGRATYFERGHIYWTGRIGAKVVYGGILNKYLKLGGPAKWGFPTTDELSAPGGRSSRFEKARIYWSPRYDARIVYGAILKKYLELGGGSGRLGLPTSDEYSVSGGRRSDFERGFIIWDRATGHTTWKATG